MKKIITLTATILFFSLNGCAPKMIPPSDPKGLECLAYIEEIKRACYAEREHQIRLCEERNQERKKVSEKENKLTGEKNTENNASKKEKLADSIGVALKYALNLENCSNLTGHCNKEYNQNFVKHCGGRIE